MNVAFEYRDASNYKFSITASLSDAILQKIENEFGKPIEVGMDIEYDNVLGLTQDEIHEHIGYKYNDNDDHNLLEVVEILSDDAVTTFDCK